MVRYCEKVLFTGENKLSIGYLMISRGRHSFFVAVEFEFELLSLCCSSLNLDDVLLLSSVVL